MADQIYPDAKGTFSCQKALTQRIFLDPAPFVEARKNWIEQKAGWEHGKVIPFCVKESEVASKGIKRRVVGQQMDFWPLEIFNMLHPEQKVDAGSAEQFTYGGKKYSGVWRPAVDMMLPKGALCRAQEELIESNEMRQEVQGTGSSAPLFLDTEKDLKKQKVHEEPKVPLLNMELDLDEHWADIGLELKTRLSMRAMPATLKKEAKSFQSRYLISNQHDCSIGTQFTIS